MQWHYIAHTVLSIDDFWLAYHTQEYQSKLPYRDFLPYKSVLGYYLMLIPLSIFHGVLTPLLYTKAWMAFINAVFLIGISLGLSRFYSPKAVIASLVLILCTPIFYLFSSDIRVDLLAYWMCLISVLLLFDKKYALAGMAIGLGFLICQKAMVYVMATNCALVGYWVIHDRSWKMTKNLLVFNGALLGMWLIYILFWSYLSNLHTVLYSLFYEPYLLLGVDRYVPLSRYYWTVIIAYSMELVVLCPVALIGLIILPVKNRTFVIIYTLVILLFMIASKQPFVYFPLMAVPAFFVLFSAFFSALHPYLSFKHQPKNSPSLILGLLFLGVLLGVVSPILRCLSSLEQYDGRYQKSMIHLMADLLKDGGNYIAGVSLLLDIDQPILGLKHLVKPSLEYMTHPSKPLQEISSLSSLYLAAMTVPELIESIQKAPIKLYVDNNRFHHLPKALFRYLDTQYQHFWGSIYLYAPKIEAGHQSIQIKFAGNYQVQSAEVIFLDNQKRTPNSIIHLNDQQHTSNANRSYRLKLIPKVEEHFLNPQFKKNHWEIMLMAT